MFDLDDDASRREKCFTAVTRLPAFVDPKQIPKRPPFSTIQSHPFVHTVEALLPAEVYADIHAALEARLGSPRYARVFMPPSALFEHDFFNTYIKSGNVLMISEGRSGSDNVFTLRDGILTIELGKEIFERTGLSGRPIRSGGRKHGKERFLVELNLRLPSMLHGKKGFERIVWAFNNVLNRSMAWLFHDLESNRSQDEDNKPIQKLHPQLIDCVPLRVNHTRVLTPPLHGKEYEKMSEGELQEHCGSLSEWIAMVQLESPRVSAGDDIDPYLSRYRVPDADDATSSDFISLKWHGLVSSEWTMQLFLTLLHHTTTKTGPSPAWFALAVSALGKAAVEGRDGFTIMTLPDGSQPAKARNAEEDIPGPGGGRWSICWDLVGASVVEN